VATCTQDFIFSRNCLFFSNSSRERTASS
jgi:hypothetical protein